ncbi:MAG: flagellar hook-length control protein FliK, partial [Armatimonadetes bacterium]|nr:flagellar hook-length control protein FliK [Armatimonadota bacterium]
PTITPDFAPPAVMSPVPLEPRRDRDEAPTERELELPLAAVLTGPTPTEAAPQAALGDAHRVAATAAVPSRETDEPDPVTHLRLRLAPPLLGEVLLDVRHDGGAVTAHAIVSLPATEHVLRQVQTQVQQLLADQGLQAGAFDLTCAYSSTGGGGGGSHLPQPFGVPSGAWAARPEVPDVTPSEAPQGPPPGWSRIVDIIA